MLRWWRLSWFCDVKPFHVTNVDSSRDESSQVSYISIIRRWIRLVDSIQRWTPSSRVKIWVLMVKNLKGLWSWRDTFVNEGENTPLVILLTPAWFSWYWQPCLTYLLSLWCFHQRDFLKKDKLRGCQLNPTRSPVLWRSKLRNKNPRMTSFWVGWLIPNSNWVRYVS